MLRMTCLRWCDEWKASNSLPLRLVDTTEILARSLCSMCGLQLAMTTGGWWAENRERPPLPPAPPLVADRCELRKGPLWTTMLNKRLP